MGLPCGTCSRARERPIAAQLRRKGAPQPAPLRGPEALFGFHHLDPSSLQARRVASANRLYEFALAVLIFCYHTECIVSIENPERSWLWAILTQLAMQTEDPAFIAWFGRLEPVAFSSCMHGGTRQKQTRWLSTPGIYTALSAPCDGGHPHAAYQLTFIGGAWKFDTASEAAYPKLLSQRCAAAAAKALIDRGYQLHQTLTLHQLAHNQLETQGRRHPVLIREFKSILIQPDDQAIPPNGKLLPPHRRGEKGEDEETSDRKDIKPGQVAIGILRSPAEFIEGCREIKHPMDARRILEPTEKALDSMVSNSRELSTLELKKNILKATMWAKQLEREEAELHKLLDTEVAHVVREKRLLLWKKLLDLTGFDDPSVFDLMTKGVPLVGACEKPACFAPKLVPARCTEDELRSSAIWRRKALLARPKPNEEREHRVHLEQTTDDEVDRGFVIGPFYSEAEVTAKLGHDRWTLVRRFVLVQGKEKKLRPIDDCLEAQLNSAYTSTIRLELQDSDYLANMALRVAEKMREAGPRAKERPWGGKCLDLSKAYKQMPILPSHRDLAVIFFKDSKGRTRFYIPRALIFGATAAVYGFNRVSRSLWWIINKFLGIPTAVYFDDFPLMVPQDLWEVADHAVSSLLHLLGWDHAATGEGSKGKPFSPVFDVLGMSLDLSQLAEGLVRLANKEGRAERLAEKIESLAKGGGGSRHDRQELHGLLNFACGFFAGRSLRMACHLLFQLSEEARPESTFHPATWARRTLSLLSQTRPKEISLGEEKTPFLIFTDGAWEAGRAGIGAYTLDLLTGKGLMWEGTVPDPIVRRWVAEVGEHIICQIELYAMVCIRRMLAPVLRCRRSIFFVDNDSARFSIIKGRSGSESMCLLAHAFHELDELQPTYWWIARVPSYSNPSDAPSRGRGSEEAKTLHATLVGDFDHDPRLSEVILNPGWQELMWSGGGG